MATRHLSVVSSSCARIFPATHLDSGFKADSISNSFVASKGRKDARRRRNRVEAKFGHVLKVMVIATDVKLRIWQSRIGATKLTERFSLAHRTYVDKEWFKRVLAGQGKTQFELAASMGLSKSAFSNIVNNKRMVKAEEVLKISEFLRVNPDLVFSALGLDSSGDTASFIYLFGEFRESDILTLFEKTEVIVPPSPAIKGLFSFSSQTVRVVGHQFSPRYFNGELLSYSDMEWQYDSFEPITSEVEGYLNTPAPDLVKVDLFADDPDNMLPTFMPERWLDRDVVAKLSDGSRVIGRLRSSEHSGRFIIMPVNGFGQPKLNVELVWATPIAAHWPT